MFSTPFVADWIQLNVQFSNAVVYTWQLFLKEPQLLYIPLSALIVSMSTNKSNLRGLSCVTKVFIKMVSLLFVLRATIPIPQAYTPLPRVFTLSMFFFFHVRDSFSGKINWSLLVWHTFSIPERFNCTYHQIYIIRREFVVLSLSLFPGQSATKYNIFLRDFALNPDVTLLKWSKALPCGSARCMHSTLFWCLNLFVHIHKGLSFNIGLVWACIWLMLIMQ